MLNKIKLTNFKCFENIELELKNLNVLSGINSMGKSTIVQSLLLIRQSFESDSLDKGFYLNGDYTQIGTGKDLMFFNAKKDEVKIELLNNQKEKIEWVLDFARDANYLCVNSEKSNGLDEIGKKELNFLNDNFEYVSAERIGPRKSYLMSDFNVSFRHTVGVTGEHAVYYLLKYGPEPLANDNVLLSDSNNLMEQVDNWMSQITPGVKLNVNDMKQADLVCLQIRQEENAATMGTVMDYKPVNVGFGISYVLPIIISLLKAKKGDMVILENPEAHLHPKGQRKIGELIARAAQGGSQILIETHSDHILNGIRLAVKNNLLDRENVKLFYFGLKDENNITYHMVDSPEIDSKGGLNFWPEGFFDEWDNALIELL